MKKILVTGGAGFIGSNIIEFFRSLNYTIVSVDDYSTGSINNHFNHVYYYDLSVTDLHHKKNYDSKNIDYIIHCAAKARISKSWEDPVAYMETNIVGTQSVISFAIDQNIPLLYIGTGSHHGGRLSNPYTFSKDIGEELVLFYQKKSNLKASIARLYNVYGPRELTDKNGTFIGKLKYAYKHKLPFTVYGDGTKKRDFTHIYDIREAIYTIVNENIINQTFELGSGKNYSINEIIDFLGYKNIFYSEESIEGEMQDTLANTEQTKAIIKWEPKYCIKKYIESIKNGYYT